MAGFSASSVSLNGNTIDRCVWQEISPGSSQRPATSTTSSSGRPWRRRGHLRHGAVGGGLDSPARRRSPVSTSITWALTNQVRAGPLPI